MKVLVVFYSMYGHIYRMAEAVAEGAREIPGATAELRRSRRRPGTNGRAPGPEGIRHGPQRERASGRPPPGSPRRPDRREARGIDRP